MKFEKPIMNISKFDVENIVTDSTNTNFGNAGSQADSTIEDMKKNGQQAVKIAIQFTL